MRNPQFRANKIKNMNEIEEFYKFSKIYWIFAGKYGIMYVAAADCAFRICFLKAHFALTEIFS